MADRILIVEDEAHLAQGIRFNLELEGYQVEMIADGSEALERLASPQVEKRLFDLVLLDVMLPGTDGFAVVREMRQAGNFTPVLMLTAKGLPGDVVSGMEAGADDYLPKPFDLQVLLARVKGLLRRRDWTRGEPGELSSAAIGEARVDFRNFEIEVRGQRFPMTVLETMLLKLLWEKAGNLVSKGEILQKVWNLSPDTETRAVDNFIVRLRRFLEQDPSHPTRLLTVRGAGYKLVV